MHAEGEFEKWNFDNFFEVGGDKTIALCIVLKNENIGKIQMQLENSF